MENLFLTQSHEHTNADENIRSLAEVKTQPLKGHTTKTEGYLGLKVKHVISIASGWRSSTRIQHHIKCFVIHTFSLPLSSQQGLVYTVYRCCRPSDSGP